MCKTVKIVLQCSCTLPVDQGLGLGLPVNLLTKCTAHFQLNPLCTQITTAVCLSLFRYTLERLHMQFLMFLSPKNIHAPSISFLKGSEVGVRLDLVFNYFFFGGGGGGVHCVVSYPQFL